MESDTGAMRERPEALAVHADFAKADHDVAAVGRKAEAQARAEARKHEDLVDLAPNSRIVGSGKNSVGNHIALSIQRRFDHQRAGRIAVARH